jgi:hypothetical protein
LKYDFSFLRIVLRPPILIFLLILIGSLIGGSAVIQLTLSSHQKGNYLLYDDNFVTFEFPMDWLGFSWEEQDITTGNVYSALVSPPLLYSILIIRIFDEQAKQILFDEKNLTDENSLNLFEASLLLEFAHSLTENSENATLSLIKQGRTEVSNYNAYYANILISDVVDFNSDTGEEITYNLKATFVSYIKSQNVIEVIFYGEEEDYNDMYSIFERIVDSIEVKV